MIRPNINGLLSFICLKLVFLIKFIIFVNLIILGDKKAAQLELKSQYGKGKTANIVLEAESTPQEYSVDLLANAPQAEKLKKLALGFKTKVSYCFLSN